jgi:hypothetical protein
VLPRVLGAQLEPFESLDDSLLPSLFEPYEIKWILISE